MAQDSAPRRLAVAEIFITPLGTSESTIREYIRALVPILKASGLVYQLTAMGTLVEGPVDELLTLARALHDATFDAHLGADRVVTHLRLDERRGEPLTLEGKVQGALGLRPDQQARP
ncbi:MAG: MTH1187 family thiamine-binding protein [Candidatus Eisenbacteria bacterium]